MTKTVVAGIDYSMTSPAMCIHVGDVWDFKACKFFYMSAKEKFVITTKIIFGTKYPEWDQPEQRFNNLSSWASEILKSNKATTAMIEGYAYGAGSKGLVFQIGENTGCLKQKIWAAKIPFSVTPPTVIKKFATGKGNANKELMWDFFLAETKINLFHLLGQEEKKNWNPVSDIVDAYFIAKYLHFGLTSVKDSVE